MRLLAILLASCAAEPSESLAGEGLYADIATKRVAGDVVPFAPTYELWLDGATKQRWLSLPPGTTIDTSDMAHWQPPVGAKLFKEISVAGRRIETRVVERTAAGFRFATFAWRDDESDADPVADGVSGARGTTYDIPPTTLCPTCHASEPGAMLGVSYVQSTLDADLLSDPPAQPFAMPAGALGILHANCGHCHTAGGIAPFQQLRLVPDDAGRAVADTGVGRSIIGIPLDTWTGPPEINIDLRVAPGDPGHSAIYYRMAQRGRDQMPPIGTTRRDDADLAAVAAWIAAL